MVYANESKNKGWGLPIGLLALILMIALMGTAGAPTSAFAANIGCGQCHGTLDNGTNAVISNTTDRRGVSVPGYESSTMPQTDNGITARGMHGIHMNYSSASYGMALSSRHLTNPPTRGNCNYCHNGHPRHAAGFVNFTSSAAIEDLALNQPRQPLLGNKYLMLYTSAGRGVSYKNNIPSLDNNAYGNCTVACHKGTSGSNPAPWGNYTSVSIKLNCASCHDDATNNGAGLSSPGNYGHNIHLNGSWLGKGANKTMIVMGSYSGYLNAGDNSTCQFCHPENRNDLWSQGRADDGSKKAYPHAKDGTNVISKNAVIGGQAGVTLANWTGTYTGFTCTASCHVQRSSYQSDYARWNGAKPATGTFSNCEICHQHKASAAINNSSNVPLTYAHSLHFANLSTSAGLVACSVCHLGVHTNFANMTMITRLPVTPGNAGLLSTMNWSRAGVSAVNGTCQNTCHVSASPAWNTIATGSITGINGCAGCHEYPGATGRDWTTTGNGHLVRYDAPVVNTHMKASGFNYQTDTFASATADTGKCGLCHKGVKHMNGSGFAHLSSIGNAQCGTTPFTFSSGGVGNGTNTTCGNVKCHSGKTTPNWW